MISLISPGNQKGFRGELTAIMEMILYIIKVNFKVVGFWFFGFLFFLGIWIFGVRILKKRASIKKREKNSLI